ncbi:thioredoxin domain-containing protein [Taibaiella koreensis]|uniref:thioredoxin domain-containing protein n=1 Tax=Taibaiella koreensis TaxID=1268548 RepID=UPI000E59BEBC|nr:thioredoxin domain-containing protein [Taibaiella koreensis]
MKKIMLTAALAAGIAAGAAAQNKSDFEMIKSDNKHEVIYMGPVTFEDIGQVKAFQLEKKSEQYKPDPQVLEILSDKLKNYRMIVFLGTWCEDSHKLIPELYRVLTATSYPEEQLQLYALDRDKHGKEHEEQAYHITNVPTIILLQNDKEKGRITEVVEKSIESDLLHIIEKE